MINLALAVVRHQLMTSLTSGMNLMGLDISLQYIVRAAVLVAAVIFDVITRSRRKSHRKMFIKLLDKLISEAILGVDKRLGAPLT